MESATLYPSLNNIPRETEATHAASTSAATFDNLYPALVECFGIILVGYLAGRFSFISDVEAKGLATFVGTFSLPALIFGNLCTIDVSSMNWRFLLAILVAKALVFALVLAISLLVSQSLGKSGLFAIFVTQSNDFALGYPILKSLYQNSAHPNMPMYLYLLAPVNLVILNPIGFICMEIDKQMQGGHHSGQKTVLRIVKGIVTNPIIYMSVLGMIFGTFVFNGKQLPPVMANFLETLGNAFPAAALFLLGIHMVGRVQGMGKTMIIPIVLVVIKLVVLPLVARETTSLFNPGANATETAALSDFAFLYGTFPVAPTVFVFATQYAIMPELMANGLVLCTVIAAPIMFISGKLILFELFEIPHFFLNVFFKILI